MFKYDFVCCNEINLLVNWKFLWYNSIFDYFVPKPSMLDEEAKYRIGQKDAGQKWKNKVIRNICQRKIFV